MTIPEEIKICGRIYKICFANEEMARQECDGFIQHHKQSIMLRDDIHRERQEQTLVHEILHAIDGNYSVRDDGIRFSETEIGRLTAGLYQVIQDNPELWAISSTGRAEAF